MIKKPWGSEVILFESGEARVKLLRVKPEKRLSEQYHREKQEAMMLLSGFAVLVRSGRNDVMTPGKIFDITPGSVHRVETVAAYGMRPTKHEAVILEMAHGSDEDIVRLADDFGRASI